MPQMAPMWWSTLFIMFILSFIMFNIIVYFFYKPNKTYINNTIKLDQMIWKW